MNDKQRKILASKNITFACFKMVLSALLTKANIDEDSFVEAYEDYAEFIEKYDVSIEEWAEDFYQDFNLDQHPYQLRSKNKRNDPVYNFAHKIAETLHESKSSIAMFFMQQAFPDDIDGLDQPSLDDILINIIQLTTLAKK